MNKLSDDDFQKRFDDAVKYKDLEELEWLIKNGPPGISEKAKQEWERLTGQPWPPGSNPKPAPSPTPEKPAPKPGEKPLPKEKPEEPEKKPVPKKKPDRTPGM